MVDVVRRGPVWCVIAGSCLLRRPACGVYRSASVLLWVTEREQATITLRLRAPAGLDNEVSRVCRD